MNRFTGQFVKEGAKRQTEFNQRPILGYLLSERKEIVQPSRNDRINIGRGEQLLPSHT